jgi:hypothetical protein
MIRHCQRRALPGSFGTWVWAMVLVCAVVFMFFEVLFHACCILMPGSFRPPKERENSHMHVYAIYSDMYLKELTIDRPKEPHHTPHSTVSGSIWETDTQTPELVISPGIEKGKFLSTWSGLCRLWCPAQLEKLSFSCDAYNFHQPIIFKHSCSGCKCLGSCGMGDAKN